MGMETDGAAHLQHLGFTFLHRCGQSDLITHQRMLKQILTLGFLGLAMGWYSPVSGSWLVPSWWLHVVDLTILRWFNRCWLEAKPVYLRYVLMHGWRFLFIIIEACCSWSQPGSSTNEN